MANQKVSQLTAASALTGAEQAYVVQSSASRRTTTQDIANLAPGTDLSYTASSRLLASSSGADVTLPVATTSLAGLLSAADKTKLDGLSTFDPASPGAIGGTVAAAGSFTSLSASSRLNVPSSAAGSPAARDVYAVADTLRYRDSGNVERLLLNAADNLANLASAATARTNLGLGTLATQSGTFSGSSSGINTGDQTITLTGDVTGSGTGSFAATLASTAVTPGSYAYASLTVDAKGRLTAASSGTAPVTTVTGTAPIVSSGGTAPAISISAASTSAAGSMSATDKAKLDGIAAGATANSSDATLLNRANHTGTQTASTISDFSATARGAISATGSLSYNSTTGVISYSAPTPFDPASPGAIGGTTPAAGSFTTLSASTSLLLPSGASGTPVARHLYAVSDTLRYRDSGNVERLLLNAADNLANLSNTATARSNLGLGTAATSASTAFAASGLATASGLTMSTARLLGRSTASTGAIEEISLPTGFGLTSGALTAPAEIGIACSDETTALTTGTAKVTFRMPYAMTLTAVRLSVTTAPTGSALIVNIKEAGTTIFSTKPQIDAAATTSVGSGTAAVISDSALADNAVITIDVDQIGSTVAGAGLKVWLIGRRA